MNRFDEACEIISEELNISEEEAAERLTEELESRQKLLDEEGKRLSHDQVKWLFANGAATKDKNGKVKINWNKAAEAGWDSALGGQKGTTKAERKQAIVDKAKKIDNRLSREHTKDRKLNYDPIYHPERGNKNDNPDHEGFKKRWSDRMYKQEFVRNIARIHSKDLDKEKEQAEAAKSGKISHPYTSDYQDRNKKEDRGYVNSTRSIAKSIDRHNAKNDKDYKEKRRKESENIQRSKMDSARAKRLKKYAKKVSEELDISEEEAFTRLVAELEINA